MWIHVKNTDNSGVLPTDVTPLSVSTAEMLDRHQHVLAMSWVINLTVLVRVISGGATSYDCLTNRRWRWLIGVSSTPRSK